MALFSVVTARARILTPCVAIPTVPGGGNHTREFTRAASTDAAHEACYDVSKALAHVGMRVLTDAAFLARVRLDSFVRPLGGVGTLNRVFLSFRSRLRLRRTRRRGEIERDVGALSVYCNAVTVCVTRRARSKGKCGDHRCRRLLDTMYVVTAVTEAENFRMVLL